MVYRGTTVVMQFLQVLYQVVNPLGIQILESKLASAHPSTMGPWTNLANNLRRLRIINCTKVLLHGCVVIPTLIQKIAVFAIDGILLQRIDANLLSKVDSQDVEVAFIENFKPLLKTLFPVPEDLPEFREPIPPLGLELHTFPSVVSKNKSPHSMKICFIGAARASL